MFDWLMIAATLYILVYIAATIAAFIKSARFYYLNLKI